MDTYIRYISLHYIALHCIALLCIALHYITLHCIALHCTALHCTALHCTALHCTTYIHICIYIYIHKSVYIYIYVYINHYKSTILIHLYSWITEIQTSQGTAWHLPSLQHGIGLAQRRHEGRHRAAVCIPKGSAHSHWGFHSHGLMVYVYGILTMEYWLNGILTKNGWFISQNSIKLDGLCAKNWWLAGWFVEGLKGKIQSIMDNGWCIRENPVKIDDLGCPHFRKPLCDRTGNNGGFPEKSMEIPDFFFCGKNQGKNTCLGSAWLNDLTQWSPAKLEDGKPNRSGSVQRALSRTLDDMGIQVTNKRWFQRPKHIDLMGSSTTAAKTSMNGCVQYSGSQIWYHKPTL